MTDPWGKISIIINMFVYFYAVLALDLRFEEYNSISGKRGRFEFG